MEETKNEELVPSEGINVADTDASPDAAIPGTAIASIGDNVLGDDKDNPDISGQLTDLSEAIVISDQEAPKTNDVSDVPSECAEGNCQGSRQSEEFNIESDLGYSIHVVKAGNNEKLSQLRETGRSMGEISINTANDNDHADFVVIALRK